MITIFIYPTFARLCPTLDNKVPLLKALLNAPKRSFAKSAHFSFTELFYSVIRSWRKNHLLFVYGIFYGHKHTRTHTHAHTHGKLIYS